MSERRTLQDIAGIGYTLANGEWVTLHRLTSTLFPSPMLNGKLAVYVMEGSRSSMNDMIYIFSVSPHCKRYLRVGILPDTIKEKLAWALVQEPVDPYGETSFDDRDFSGFPDDEMGMRLDESRCIVFLTKEEYEWLYSEPIRVAEKSYMEEGMLSKKLLMQGVKRDT